MSKELVKERVIKYLMEDLLVPHDIIDTDVMLVKELRAELEKIFVDNKICFLTKKCQ